jgi:hypothetical protein
MIAVNSKVPQVTRMTRMYKLAAALALGVASIGLAGCQTGFPARVARFNAMPAPAGQSFFVVASDPRKAGGLEFSRYAGVVADAMRAYGYAPATSPGAATMLVNVDYGVDNGSQEIRSYPTGYSGFNHPFYYPRFGYWGHWSPFYYGWDDPFWYGRDIDTYTVYKSYLDVNIRRRVDNASLFEGHARARSGGGDLTKLVPNLVTALFTGFPGQNGETVKITVPPEQMVKGTRPAY